MMMTNLRQVSNKDTPDMKLEAYYEQDPETISIYIKMINQRIGFSNECFSDGSIHLIPDITLEQYEILAHQCIFESALDQFMKTVELSLLYCSYINLETFKKSLNLNDIMQYITDRLKQSFMEFNNAKSGNTDVALYKLEELYERANEAYETGFVIYKLTTSDPFPYIKMFYDIRLIVQTLQEIWIYKNLGIDTFKEQLISQIRVCLFKHLTNAK